MVLVTIFMEGLRTGVARTEVFRVHPTFFGAAIDIVLNADFNFKSDRFGIRGYNSNWSNSFNFVNRPEPMDLCLVDTNKEAELEL